VGRADALLVLRAEPVNGRAALLLPPRDLAVGDPEDPLRLNEAYAAGASSAGGDDPTLGSARLRAAAGSALGLRIHAGVVVDMTGFAGVVDALGGVRVDVPHEIDDRVEEDGEVFVARFAPGPQVLDGEQAVVYARTRMADGDRWRRDRHAQLVRGLVGSALRAGRTPWRWPRIVRAVRGAVTVEPGVGRLLLAGLTVARRRGRLETVALAPPEVRSVRLARGWFHVAEPAALQAAVRERYVAGVR
jgi:LCP family protein required for cell wall assembly